ncbi:MAG TPA: ATP-dependent DNA ligase [Gemmatimonadales bacterium]|nr:ATP-dependent DNA ligase [Gemmatimonadales bacterium]
MLLRRIVSTSSDVAKTSSRLAKIERLAELLLSADAFEIETTIAFLTGALRQTKIGVGYSLLQRVSSAAAAKESTLALGAVDAALDRLEGAAGKGSAKLRETTLRELFERATKDEQEFLFRLMTGEVRQGALEGIMIEAVARAAGVEAPRVRRATMLAGDLRLVARAALTEGATGLDQFAIQLFRPVQPMLAQTADDVPQAIAQLGRAALEIKLDGARIQVHRSGTEVRVFSRLLNDVTPAVPEVVDVVCRLAVPDVILDGEAIALRADGSPQPFQTTMRRFGRKLDVDALRSELPLVPFFFDILYAGGRTLIDEPYERRAAILADLVPESERPARLVTAEANEAQAFYDRAIVAGHEGVMAKALAAPYEAGSRGSAWLKIKAVHTLDLVVLAAEWGHGRRKGKLSNLHLGARDSTGGFVMLGKTFKGLTDELLEWQTKRLLDLATEREGHIVWVRPELVVEIAFNGLQASPHYPGGLALRFARVLRYRPDKSADQADTIETVRGLHRA